MQSNFEYLFQEEAMDSIDVEDIGNCSLAASNDIGQFWYLFIITEFGITRILEYGPWEDGGFPLYLSSTFQQFEYNEKKILKVIRNFLNNKIRDITQAFEVDFEDVKHRLVDPVEFLYDE